MHFCMMEETMVARARGLLAVPSVYFNLPVPESGSSVEEIVALPIESVYSSIRGDRQKSWTVNAFNFQ